MMALRSEKQIPRGPRPARDDKHHDSHHRSVTASIVPGQRNCHYEPTSAGEGSPFAAQHKNRTAIHSIICRAILVLLLVQCAALAAFAQDTESWFSLTSQKTFLPGEKPEIAVNAHNVKQLEFRVYRVNNPVKFFSQMQELHNFGGQGPKMPKQSHSWLERFTGLFTR